MKRIIIAMSVAVMICAGLFASALVTENRDRPAIGNVLKAHGVTTETGSLSAFFIEAVKLTSIEGGPTEELPGFFERKTTLASDGRFFRRSKIDSQGLLEEVVLLDGLRAYRVVRESGQSDAEAEELQGNERDGVRFIAATSGLAPVLARLNKEKTAFAYKGETSRGWSLFTARTDIGNVSIFADRERVIRRIEAAGFTIEYAGYREVDGVLLPFIQRVYRGSRLLYELFFINQSLKPQFTDDYFKLDTATSQPTQ